ncbi:hypothetical protein F3Y22_tig00110578pilonHSYRG00185 [Hibiscus syriacus]|uniref:Uncharacterized protein n=1 Tax=Hibiscus syriacus TaxID=106335 RepID=A0A6A3A5K4_HIBSY|nr:hypothetical protein F3Y22_tig00110578pilonHSYRG00185 [Hibiscus syriacus]
MLPRHVSQHLPSVPTATSKLVKSMEYTSEFLTFSVISIDTSNDMMGMSPKAAPAEPSSRGVVGQNVVVHQEVEVVKQCNSGMTTVVLVALMDVRVLRVI